MGPPTLTTSKTESLATQRWHEGIQLEPVIVTGAPLDAFMQFQ